MRKFILIFILPLLLMSCSTNPEITRIGPGVIKSETQLMTKEEVQKEQAKKGAKTGAEAGAVTGTIFGTFGGFVAGGFLVALCQAVTLGVVPGYCLVYLPFAMVAGAGSGALIGAGSGALVGAGGKYVYATKKEHIIGKYRYEVLPDGQDKTITFEQYPDRLFNTGDRVDLFVAKYKDTTTYFIKPLDEIKDNDNKPNDKEKGRNESKDDNTKK